METDQRWTENPFKRNRNEIIPVESDSDDEFVTTPSPSSRGQRSQRGGRGRHVRAYQACDACRSRRLKCDRGPVDAPRDPPCADCRRKGKECTFAETRRKQPGGSGNAVSPIRSRKRTKSESEPDDILLDNGQSDLPGDILPNYGNPNAQPTSFRDQVFDGYGLDLQFLRFPVDDLAEIEYDLANGRVTEPQAITILKTKLTHPIEAAYDRLKGNFTEAGAKKILEMEDTGPVAIEYNRAVARAAQERASKFSKREFPTPGSIHSSFTAHQAPQAQSRQISSHARRDTESTPSTIASPQPSEAWNMCRFVQSGLISPAEGALMVNYFYKHLAPLTALPVPDYSDPKSHEELIFYEPVLCVTILAIASRYCSLGGFGSMSRGCNLHRKLVKEVQDIVYRILWAEDSFVGSLSDKSNCWATSSSHSQFRTMGTIESLLILTEWHGRSLHFFSGDGQYGLLAHNIMADKQAGASDSSSGEHHVDWQGPVWRSERLTLFLLGFAKTLAFELGILRVMPIHQRRTMLVAKPRLVKRRDNILRILFVYLTLKDINLPMTPDKKPTMDKAATSGENPSVVKDARAKKQQLECSCKEDPAFLESLELENLTVSAVQDFSTSRQLILSFWVETASFYEDVSIELLDESGLERQAFETGSYRTSMQLLGDRLKTMRGKLNSCTFIPESMRHILNMEYDFNRVRVFDLALQAVFRRFKINGESLFNTLSASRSAASSSEREVETLSPSDLRKWCDGDREFIDEVVEAGQRFMHSVVEGLRLNGGLRHAPARIYFRIVFVAMSLLRCFATGQRMRQGAKTLSLLKVAGITLQKYIVDDIHVGASMGRTIQNLTEQVNFYLVRFGKPRTAPKSHTRHTSTSRSMQTINYRSSGLRHELASQTQHEAGMTNNISGSVQTQQTETLNDLNPVAHASYFEPTSGPQPVDQPVSPFHFGHSDVHAGDNLSQLLVNVLEGIPFQDFNEDSMNKSYAVVPPPLIQSAFETRQDAVAENTQLEDAGANGITPYNGLSNAEPLEYGDSDDIFAGIDWMGLPLDHVTNGAMPDIFTFQYNPDPRQFDGSHTN